MKTRRTLLVLGLVLAAVLFVALPGRKPQENPFPLTKDVVENALKEQNLPWEIGEAVSFSKGHLNYQLLNENGKLTANIDSARASNEKGELVEPVHPANERRYFALQLIKPLNFESRLTQAVTQEQWPVMFDLACSLYGGRKDGKALFKQFLRDTKDEAYEPKDRVVRWHQQIGGVHYVVAMRPSEKYYGRFDLLSISIMNNLCYQDYLAQVQRLEASKSEKANT